MPVIKPLLASALLILLALTVTACVLTAKAEFSPSQYDADGDGSISKAELITAVNDYLFNDTITKSQLIQVINTYLFGDRVNTGESEPTPTPTPRPTPTLTPTPTPTPTPLPTICTYHPQDRLNREWNARDTTYQRWLRNNPTYRSYNPTFREILENKSAEVNARYVLEHLYDPVTGTRSVEFRTWLENTDVFAGYNFKNKLLSIHGESRAFLPQAGQALSEWAAKHPNDCNPYYELLQDEILASVIIIFAETQSLNPSLRRSYANSLADSFLAWKDGNPNMFLFAEYARRGMDW